jgi:hypothetical protein
MSMEDSVDKHWQIHCQKDVTVFIAIGLGSVRILERPYLLIRSSILRCL